MTTPAHRWIISQIGAREHYAVARAMAGRGQLHTLYTDAWCNTGRSLLNKGPASLRAMAGRWHGDVPSDRVVSFTGDALWNSIAHRTDGSVEAAHLEHIRIGRVFSQRVARHLKRQSLDPSRDVFFGYDTGCLETLELMREKGIFSIVDQIDPARMEEQIVEEEARRWPGWQKASGRVPEAYWERLAREWELANVVLVNSQWSKDALIQQGVPAAKIIVVPLAYEPGNHGAVVQRNRQAGVPLRVLFLGSVILRKGIQYLIEAAKLIVDENVRIIVAGPIGISDEAVRSAPANMTFLGRITRERTAELYWDADVFVLPTVSDGFAITQLEAMSHGLPVITTPNCGQVVSDGVDGYIHQTRDSHALAKILQRMAGNRGSSIELGKNARLTAERFSIDQLSQNLDDMVGEGRP